MLMPAIAMALESNSSCLAKNRRMVRQCQKKEKINGYTWSYSENNGEVTIVSESRGRFSCAVSPSPRGCITIPSSLGGARVARIGRNAFKDCKGLAFVTIPESVNSIGSGAFMGCTGLKLVTIPMNVTNIGESAFYDCRILTAMTMPPNLRSIGPKTFMYCNGLTSLTIPETVTNIGDSAFEGCGKLTLVTIPSKVVNIGDAVFSACGELRQINVEDGNQNYTSSGGILYSKDKKRLVMCPGKLASVTIPYGVTSIGGGAFKGCKKLTSVTMPESVTNIEWNAFRECGELTEAILPNGLTSIERGVFCHCSKLTSVMIPPNVRSIGNWAFWCCGGLTSVTIPECVTNIGKKAFWGCKGLTTVSLPQSLVGVEGDAFRVCTNLTSVIMPENVANIGGCVFAYCTGLQQINVAANNQKYTSIDGVLYTKDCTKLVMCPNGMTSVTIPESVTNIGLGAFCGCGELTAISIPQNVRNIGGWAFEMCEGLVTVTIPDNVAHIGESAFLKCHRLESVVMRGGCPGARNNVFGDCDRLTAIHVPSNSLSWAKMKDWQGIPLVFDGEAMGQEALAREALAQREAERAEQRRQLLAIQEELERVRQAKVSTAKGACAVRCDTNKSTLGKGIVAEKLGECDFLLNKDFKKNAKVYLCLFSASWCPPCRREMPRIAKTYVETLKDDPDIELVHFSCDRDEEKAMAWAKEHNVKFPVVKPNGGNPLDLHSRGIPHLFIVKADGTLIEQGHPMNIFNEEKFREMNDKVKGR